jgi:XapX domain-containing protein
MSATLLAILQGILVGLAIGVVFGFLRLQPPAPPTLAGVLAIVAIFAGWWLASAALS